MRKHLFSRVAALSFCCVSAQTQSPLNASELSALLGNFKAVTVTAPAGTQRADISATSQLGGSPPADQSYLYTGSHRLSVYDFRAPMRLLVGLAGDPIGRGVRAAELSLPGLAPCGPEQQLAVLGASTTSETNVVKQCLGMGDRAEGSGGSAEVLLEAPLQLNTWTPVYRWYFLAGRVTSPAAFDAADDEARKNPAAQMVWWVYFSSSKDSEVGPPPLYTPRP